MPAVVLDAARAPAPSQKDAASAALLILGAAALFVGTLFYARLTPAALVFDSMTAALLWPLAHASDSAAFLGFKAWFDFLFAAGDVPYGVGFIAILWADASADSPLLPKPLSFAGLAIGAAAAISGLGYVTDVMHIPLAIGISVTFGCLVLAALGVRILQRGPIAI